MGDPKQQGRKYDTPSHPWREERMEREERLIGKYGLKNKKEFWRAESELRNYRRKARELLAELGGAGETPESVEREAQDLLAKLTELGLLSSGDELGDVLTLRVEDLLDRRLQTVVYRQGLAQTPQQARQFVVHGHVAVDGQKTTIPSYKVNSDEDNTVTYRDASPLSDEAHPEAS